jgi:hypothetical protein
MEAAMSGNQHPRHSDQLPRDDLKDNPGIGSSKGSFSSGEDPEEIEGLNTAEGDVGNDTTRVGGVDPRQRGRTNK